MITCCCGPQSGSVDNHKCGALAFLRVNRLQDSSLYADFTPCRFQAMSYKLASSVRNNAEPQIEGPAILVVEQIGLTARSQSLSSFTQSHPRSHSKALWPRHVLPASAQPYTSNIDQHELALSPSSKCATIGVGVAPSQVIYRFLQLPSDLGHNCQPCRPRARCTIVAMECTCL